MQCLQHFLSLDAYLLTHYTDYSTVVIFPLDCLLVKLYLDLYANMRQNSAHVGKQVSVFEENQNQDWP